jgi:hypothetical protein
MGVGRWMLGGLAIVGGIAALLAITPEHAPCTSELDAASMAEFFVEKRLVSPKTAEFPPERDQIIKPKGECRFEIVSHVDSQNSFGALVRSTYFAVVQYRPSTEKWHLEDIVITP